MRGFIYAAKEKSTDKFYIGLTTRSLLKRKLDHYYKSRNGSKMKFHKKISLYGLDSFSWFILDSGEHHNELAAKEKYYIKKFDSIKNGYNADIGGGIKKKVFQYTKWGLLVMEHYNLHNAAWLVRGKITSVSNACLGYLKSYKGYLWSYSDSASEIGKIKDRRLKKVQQIDLDGEIIRTFKSVSEASRITGISKTCISRCCRGERKQSNGFIWQYK